MCRVPWLRTIWTCRCAVRSILRGPATPTNFYIGKFLQQEANLNFDVTYRWKVAAFANPITVAAGLEWRNENYQQILGDTASYAAGPYTSQPLYDATATMHAASRSGRPPANGLT